jgi:hypothetical protein
MLSVYSAFKHTSLIPHAPIFLVGVFWVFWDLLLSLFSFCHPFGERDSLKKATIPEETEQKRIKTRHVGVRATIK